MWFSSNPVLQINSRKCFRFARNALKKTDTQEGKTKCAQREMQRDHKSEKKSQERSEGFVHIQVPKTGRVDYGEPIQEMQIDCRE